VLKVLAVVDAFNIFTLRVASDHDEPLLSMQVGKQRKHASPLGEVLIPLTMPAAVGLETADSKRDNHD
jgi:hypothetical protein